MPNGSLFGADEQNGTLFLAGGIPEATTPAEGEEPESFESRVTRARVRMYSNGLVYTKGMVCEDIDVVSGRFSGHVVTQFFPLNDFTAIYSEEGYLINKKHNLMINPCDYIEIVGIGPDAKIPVLLPCDFSYVGTVVSLMINKNRLRDDPVPVIKGKNVSTGSISENRIVQPNTEDYSPHVLVNELQLDGGYYQILAMPSFFYGLDDTNVVWTVLNYPPASLDPLEPTPTE